MLPQLTWPLSVHISLKRKFSLLLIRIPCSTIPEEGPRCTEAAENSMLWVEGGLATLWEPGRSSIWTHPCLMCLMEEGDSMMKSNR